MATIITMFDSVMADYCYSNEDYILIAALETAPIIIQDNMIIDNRNLIDAIMNEDYRLALRKLSSHRLIRLLHRPFGSANNIVKRVEDIYLNLLDRKGDQSKTIFFANLGLTHEENFQIQEFAANNAALNDQERLEWISNFFENEIQKPIPDFRKFLLGINYIFFDTNASMEIDEYPERLERRILKGLGYKNVARLEDDLSNTASKADFRNILLDKTRLRDRNFFGIETTSIIETALNTEAEDKIYEFIKNKTDHGRITNREIFDCLEVNENIQRYQSLVDIAYTAGFAEANGFDLFYDWTNIRKKNRIDPTVPALAEVGKRHEFYKGVVSFVDSIGPEAIRNHGKLYGTFEGYGIANEFTNEYRRKLNKDVYKKHNFLDYDLRKFSFIASAAGGAGFFIDWIGALETLSQSLSAVSVTMDATGKLLSKSGYRTMLSPIDVDVIPDKRRPNFYWSPGDD